MRIGVLTSHNGTTLQAIIDACKSKKIPGEVVLVISNNSKSGAIQRAKNHKINYIHLSQIKFPNTDKLDIAICNALMEAKVDIVFLAGYMKKLGSQTLSEFKGKILNTHPALLPKFGGKGMYGIKVYEAVIKANEKVSGVSIHYVEQDYDTGTVIATREILLEPGETADTLREKVMQQEKLLIVETLRNIAMGNNKTEL